MKGENKRGGGVGGWGGGGVPEHFGPDTYHFIFVSARCAYGNKLLAFTAHTVANC